jgi:uncharacterized protein (TIGR01319 family)
MERITRAKGLEKLRGAVPVVLPTPMAVLQGARLGAQGTAEEEGWGDMLVVDVGGATTDVHSLAYGTPSGPHMTEPGLPEPYAKRTVEGDLGIRFNAATLIERIGRDRVEREFRIAFPRFAVSSGDIAEYVNAISGETSRTPRQPWESAVDAQLARAAVDFAVERHVGKRERIVTREGEAWMHYGKDLSDARTLVGTGGVFIHNPLAAHILSGTRAGSGRHEVLRPRNPELFTDGSYLLYAVGLLADTRPDVALRIFKSSMKRVGTAPVRSPIGAD